MAWDWDIGQWFTPPKSKSPWTAMTTGGTHKNTALERWGPGIMSVLKYIPVVGQVASVVGGSAGMGGRKTGFQGTDYGWGNVSPMISGVMGSYSSNPLSGLQNSGNKRDSGFMGLMGSGYDTDYDRSLDPKGKQFDFSQLLSILGSMVGNKYGGGFGSSIGSNIGSQAGTQIGNQFYGNKETGYSYNPSWQNSLMSIMNRR